MRRRVGGFILVLGLAACADSLALATAAPGADGGSTPTDEAGVDGAPESDGGSVADATSDENPCVDPSITWSAQSIQSWQNLGTVSPSFDAGGEVSFGFTTNQDEVHLISSGCNYILALDVTATDPTNDGIAFLQLDGVGDTAPLQFQLTDDPQFTVSNGGGSFPLTLPDPQRFSSGTRLIITIKQGSSVSLSVGNNSGVVVANGGTYTTIALGIVAKDKDTDGGLVSFGPLQSTNF